MYDLLRAFARQNIRSWFFEEMLPWLDYESVQGIHVSFDPFWIREWTINNLLFNTYAHYNNIMVDISWLRNRLLLDIDLDFRPPQWRSYCNSQGLPEDSGPFRIIVLLKHEVERTDNFRDKRLRPSLHGAPIFFEVRPPCVAISLLGNLSPTRLVERFARSTKFLRRFESHDSQDGVLRASSYIRSGDGDLGTIGGFLKSNSDNKHYLITCAHVSTKGCGSSNCDCHTVHTISRMSNDASAIGGSVFHRLANPLVENTSCRQIAYPDAGKLDAVAIEINGPSSTRRFIPSQEDIAYWATDSQMNENDLVFFHGASSGRVNAQMGSYCLWRAYSAYGEMRCFGDLFEMTHPKPYYFNSNLVKGGDSGSWVFRLDNGSLIWYGMLIASDGATAYGCFAHSLVEELQSHIGSNLTMVNRNFLF